MSKNRIILFTMLTMLLAACQKEHGIGIDNDRTQLEVNVTIDGREVVPQSRAVQIADVDLITQGFTVAGYRTEGTFEENKATVVPNLFNADEVSDAIPKVDYTLNEKGEYKFWLAIPRSRAQAGSNLSFFAWSQSTPYDPTYYGIIAHSADNAKGYPWIDVVNNAMPDRQNDVVVSAVNDLDNEYLISLVNLNFKHIYSKLSFKVKSSTGNSITLNSATIKYGSNVYTKGRYTFDGSISVGAWSGLATAAVVSPTLNAGLTITGTTAVDLGQMMIIPQTVTDGFVSVVVKYNILGKEVTKTVPLKGSTLKQNTNYQYTIDITTQGVEIADPRIVNWYDDRTPRLPSVTGPMGDDLLLLDGSEAPYTHTDGTRWWLDHSGYNHHCQIIETTTDKITYNSTKKAYTITRTNGEDGSGTAREGARIIIPDLGTTSEITTEAVLSLVAIPKIYQAYCTFFPAGGPRSFSTEFRPEKQVVLDVQNGSNSYQRLWSSTVTESQMTTKAFYVNRYKAGKEMLMTRNTLPIASLTDGSVPTYTLNLSGGLVGSNMIGDVHYFKITRKSLSDDDVRADYDVLSNKFNLLSEDPGLTPVDIGSVPRFNDNLICYLNASDAFQTIGTTKYWLDRSGKINHAVVNGSEVTQNTATHVVTLPGKDGNYFKLLNSLGQMTKGISIIFIATGSNYDVTLFSFNQYNTVGADAISSDNKLANGIRAHLQPLSNSKAQQYMWSPNGATTFGDGQDFVGSRYWWSYYASDKKVHISRSVEVGANVADYDQLTPILNHCYIGSAVGGTKCVAAKYNAILIYNKILTATEAQQVYSAVNADWTK